MLIGGCCCFSHEHSALPLPSLSPAAATLNVSLVPNPNAGPGPLAVTLTVVVSGTATGALEYWIDFEDDGTYDEHFTSNEAHYEAQRIYTGAGTHIIRVKVKRQELIVDGTSTIIVV